MRIRPAERVNGVLPRFLTRFRKIGDLGRYSSTKYTATTAKPENVILSDRWDEAKRLDV
jgi:hypothetical protein